jgi:antitoxin (DNA-binding transcriptional repressor) of toxin-antitoxin stability system
MTDPIIQRIETFRCARGPLTAERRNRGYTLYLAASGQPVARLRPAKGKDDRVEVLYWSLWKEQWTHAGPLGRAALTIDRALELIAAEDIFWTSS